MYDHPNIAFVYGFSPEDNLFHPWKGSSQTDGGRIKSKVLTADQRHFERLARIADVDFKFHFDVAILHALIGQFRP